MPIDYEAEYNNRARVPEHPQIFARWAREAEDYRAEAMKERRAELGLRYGSTMRQAIDLFSPKPDAVFPLALFIHGGYWRSLEPSLFSQVARGANAHGIAVAVVGYDLCPQVTIPEIIEQIRHACLFLWLRIGRPMMVFGHSAGGHLAAAMLATDWQALYPKALAGLVPAAYDLRPVRPHPASAGHNEQRSAARRIQRADCLPAVLGAATRAPIRRRGGRVGVSRVPAPEPSDCRGLGERRRANAL
jgi:arylformamidase